MINPQDTSPTPELLKLEKPDISTQTPDLGGLALRDTTSDEIPNTWHVPEVEVSDKKLIWEEYNGRNYLPGNKVLTDLPSHCFVLIDTPGLRANPYRINISPASLDDLDEGEYGLSNGFDNVIFKVIKSEIGTFFTVFLAENEELASEQSVREKQDQSAAQGQFVTASEAHTYFEDIVMYHEFLSLNNSPASITPLTYQVMRSFGYPELTIDGNKRLLHPTPRTLLELATAGDIPIRLSAATLNNAAKKIYYNAMPKDPFQESYSDNHYAVGVADLGYYAHDISEGHFPAIVAGGRGVLELAAPVIKKAIAMGRNVSTQIDDLSDNLNSAMIMVSFPEHIEGFQKYMQQAQDDFDYLCTAGGMKPDEIIDIRMVFMEQLLAFAESNQVDETTRNLIVAASTYMQLNSK